MRYRLLSACFALILFCGCCNSKIEPRYTVAERSHFWGVFYFLTLPGWSVSKNDERLIIYIDEVPEIRAEYRMLERKKGDPLHGNKNVLIERAGEFLGGKGQIRTRVHPFMGVEVHTREETTIGGYRAFTLRSADYTRGYILLMQVTVPYETTLQKQVAAELMAIHGTFRHFAERGDIIGAPLRYFD